MEVNVRVIAEQRHWDGGIAQFVGDHKGGKTHSERIVVHSGLPNAYFVRFPRFDRSDRTRLRRNVRDVTAAARSCVLENRNRVQIDDARRQFAIFFGRRRRVFELSDASHGVVERPVLRVALTALHRRATDRIVSSGIRREIARREVNVFERHLQFLVDSVETHAEVGASKGQRVIHTDGNAVFNPFVHTPEMRVLQVDFQRVDNARDKRELFRRTDRTAKTDGIVRRRRLPCFDVFERFRQIEFFQRFVIMNLKAGSREFEERFFRQFGGVCQNFRIKRRIIPPVGSNLT